MSERQTLSYLANRFQQHGLEPKTKYGQNFLIDLNLLEILHTTAEIDDNDVVLEIGTGMGSLTTRMACKAAWVVTVEIDSQLQQLAAAELSNYSNITQLNCDALRNKNHLRTEILECIQAKLAESNSRKFKLVANLPYNVATPILSNLLAATPIPERMVVTIQKELADRIVALPSCKDYSALSIWIQSQARCRIVRTLPPTAFWPRPKVDSAIIEIIPDARLRARIVDIPFFHEKLRSLFFHRRKFLRSQVAITFQEELSKKQIDLLLEQHQLEPNQRAEQLSVESVIELLNSARAICIRQANQLTE